MYGTNEFRKGLKIELEGQPYIMIECQFVKPGKGNAFTRTKLKHMVSGATLDRTYKSGEKVAKAHLEEHPMQYLYMQDAQYHFMNMTSYEQVAIDADRLGDDAHWLSENLEVDVLFHKGAPLTVALPNFVVLEVTQCDPGVKGDTKSNVSKPATVSTGAVVNVPMFVKEGESVRIDTRTGDYVERV